MKIKESGHILIYIAALAVCIGEAAHAQQLHTQAPPALTIAWQNFYGGSDKEAPYALIHSRDGGYVVAGNSASDDGIVQNHHGKSGYVDCWVLKLDSAGTMQWNRSFGGSSYDEAHAICEALDGGYVIAGLSRSNDGDVSGHHGGGDFADCWVVKIDSAGDLQWQRSLGGSDYDAANAIAAAPDGGFIVAGVSNSNDGDVTGHNGSADFTDFWVVKLDGTGNIRWQRSLGGSGEDEANAIAVSPDGSCVVAGVSGSNDGDVSGNHGGDDCWFVKVDSAGNLKWQRSYGGSADDGVNAIAATHDGGYAAAGYSFSNDGNVSGHHWTSGFADYWVLKLDSTGALEWAHSYGGTRNDFARAIVQTADGGYAIAGYAESGDGDVCAKESDVTTRFWIVRVDSNGSLLWQQALGRVGNNRANAIAAIGADDLIVAGTSNAVAGGFGRQENYDEWIAQLNAAPGAVVPVAVETPHDRIYPNPFSETAVLTIPPRANGGNAAVDVVLYDVAGRMALRIPGVKGESVVLNRDGLQNGLYMYTIVQGSTLLATGKVVIR